MKTAQKIDTNNIDSDQACNLTVPLSNGNVAVISFTDRTARSNINIADHFHVNHQHGDEIASLSDPDKESESPLAKADAIATDFSTLQKSKKALLIYTADCFPLFFVDQKNEIVISMHAGWRGLAKNFHLKPFKEGLCDPSTTSVYLGPSMSGQNFESRYDLWSQFECHDDQNIFEHIPGNDEQRLFHPWRMVERDFNRVGVKHFHNVEIDTFADKRFCSYRRRTKAGAPIDKNVLKNYSLLEIRSEI
ncbi:MAG: polyphenol oxidase family protein [Gammaproteobacteria bacterium]|nr:polyphenol oxidase family protein [Gammaproteobacteria bacterium]